MKRTYLITEDSVTELPKGGGSTDRYIFKPQKQYGRLKAFLILMVMVGWCLGMLFFLEEYQEPLPDASETKEEQLDWRQRPGTIYRTSSSVYTP